MTYHDEVRHAECGTPMGNWYWVGHLTYWDGARHAMPVRHAEKQLVSKIAGEKKPRYRFQYRGHWVTS